MTEKTLYDRLGGEAGIRTVVDDFYDRLVADEKLGPFFDGADLDRLRETQTAFLCEAAGGPQRYDGPPVREAHLDVPFEPAHIERAITILSATLADAGVPEEDADRVVGAVGATQAELLATDDE
ncbi:truncated hemoglobin [Halococcoides cellulosivorans]|uniref:Group 1 truncated hemoglobin n=1 Tax=Halococcoides cellulosivorans TaxID=1679096 RepID=A0A2R4WZE0_9EURY|nr:group 1 truncated hemoglobin [Halococcoides cellulosivorans]AWB26885.1 group 1 truncated hemoglobin [Halococcoides cellulosivorans]